MLVLNCSHPDVDSRDSWQLKTSQALSLKFSYQRPIASESRDFKMSSESHILSSTKNFKKRGLFRRNKNNNKPLLRQIIDLVPPWILTSCTNTYTSDKGISKYRIYDQFVALTFGQLNRCQSLSNISAGIGVSKIFIDDLKLKQNLQVKTFWGTIENAVKSQIYVALISYLLLELIKRTIVKKQ